MKRFGFLHWIAFIVIIIALLWLTISYYSLRTVPPMAFVILFTGVLVFALAELFSKNKK